VVNVAPTSDEHEQFLCSNDYEALTGRWLWCRWWYYWCRLDDVQL